ncbi:MAG: hypothetical protein UZ16_OP3001003482 [Candidatus Hinthialibacteria bacterium OLB16]|nr:MAG: hypothetical protein UZ16_OP3001003482 [Candidatus Hinthialibacteria bacterium OLB16]
MAGPQMHNKAITNNLSTRSHEDLPRQGVKSRKYRIIDEYTYVFLDHRMGRTVVGASTQANRGG